jgi:hypothetical protein
MQTADLPDSARIPADQVRAIRVVAIAAWAIGLVAVVLSARSFLANVENSDFASFYESAAAWRSGSSPFVSDWRVNLNPPLMLWLFAPFTLWPLATAAWAWIVFQLVALALLIEISAREIATPPPHGALVRGLMLTMAAPTVALAQLIREGQWILWLAVLVTLAWRFTRRNRPVAAAALVGIAIALKPFTWWFWLVLPAPFRAPMLAAGAAGLSATVVLSYLTGPDVFREWFQLSGTLTTAHLTHWLNISVPGHATRALGTSWMAGTLIVTVMMLAVFWRAQTRPSTNSGRWWLAGLASVIASPLGWAYYLVLGLGPAVAHLAANGRPTLLFGAGWIALLAVWISAVPLTWCTGIWTAGVLCWMFDDLFVKHSPGS